MELDEDRLIDHPVSSIGQPRYVRIIIANRQQVLTYLPTSVPRLCCVAVVYYAAAAGSARALN